MQTDSSVKNPEIKTERFKDRNRNSNNNNSKEKDLLPDDLIDNILKTELKEKKKKKKGIYANIGSRVSKLREINESYMKKIKAQEDELNLLDERIGAKKSVLETDMRDGKKLQDEEWVREKYNQLVAKNEILMRVNYNHVQNDPELKKEYQEKQAEVSALQNKLNNLVKKTESVKNEINILRIENSKYKTNLDQILEKKEKQSKEMDKISEEANKFLKEKGSINKQLVELNSKIDNKKTSYENKMQELNKMIDNTKKIKEFHENFALEKFSKNTFKTAFAHSMNSSMSNMENKSTNKIAEEQNNLFELNRELKAKKAQTVYLNLCRFILFKKGQELYTIIEKIKNETGVESLENLSKYLELSTRTNKLFETDLKSLNEQKEGIETQIEEIKSDIQKAQCVLNDTSTKKFNYLDKLEMELKKEECQKEKLNKKLYMLNRVIDLLANGFKDVCLKLNFFDKNLKLEGELSEGTLTKAMDFLEKKMIEIIQFNTDPLKPEENIAESEEIKNFAILEKVSDNIYSEDYTKIFDAKKINSNNLNINSIKESAHDMVNNFIKKYEKINV